MARLEEIMGTQGEQKEGNDQREVICLNLNSRVITASTVRNEVGFQARMPVSRKKVWKPTNVFWVLGECILAAEFSSPCHVGCGVMRPRHCWRSTIPWRHQQSCATSIEQCVLEVHSLDYLLICVEIELGDLSSRHGGSVLYAMWGEGPCDQVSLGGRDARSHGA